MCIEESGQSEDIHMYEIRFRFTILPLLQELTEQNKAAIEKVKEAEELRMEIEEKNKNLEYEIKVKT